MLQEHKGSRLFNTSQFCMSSQGQGLCYRGAFPTRHGKVNTTKVVQNAAVAASVRNRRNSSRRRAGGRVLCALPVTAVVVRRGRSKVR